MNSSLRRYSAHLIMVHQLENGVPVFERLAITSESASSLTSRGRAVFSEIFSVTSDESFSRAHSILVQTARRCFPWTAPYLEENDAEEAAVLQFLAR